MSIRSNGSRCKPGRDASRITADSLSGIERIAQPARACVSTSTKPADTGSRPSWCLTSNSQHEIGLTEISFAGSAKAPSAAFDRRAESVASHQNTAVSSNSLNLRYPRTAELRPAATLRRNCPEAPAVALSPNPAHVDRLSSRPATARDMCGSSPRSLRRVARAIRLCQSCVTSRSILSRYRFSTATNFRSAGPVYRLNGRMIRLFVYCSI